MVTARAEMTRQSFVISGRHMRSIRAERRKDQPVAFWTPKRAGTQAELAARAGRQLRRFGRRLRGMYRAQARRAGRD